MKTKKTTVKETVIAKVRETKKPYEGHTRTMLYKAWVSNNSIKVRTYANDSEVEMFYGEEVVAL